MPVNYTSVRSTPIPYPPGSTSSNWGVGNKLDSVDEHLVIWFSNGEILHGKFRGWRDWKIDDIFTMNGYLGSQDATSIKSEDNVYYPINTIVKFGMFTSAQIIGIKRGDKLDTILS